VEDGATRALYLENTAVIIAPLIPWSIACGVTLAAVNAPPLSVAAACYLYLLPLWQYAVVLWQRKKHPVTK
jgi:NhaC family Na+:H+ antiporter